MLEPSEKHKALTRFLCQELLYEFVIGRLDLEKQKAMDEYLSTDRECQHELERLRRGFVFASMMAKTQMSSDMRAALLGFEPLWKRRLAYWTAWWSRHGWRILPYFVLTGALALGMAVFKPWVYLQQREVVLVEEAKNATPPPAAAEAPKKLEKAEPPATEPAKDSTAPVAGAPPSGDAKLPAAPQVEKTEPSAPKTPPTAPATAPAPAAAEVKPEDSTPEATQHFWIYRAKLEVTDLAAAKSAIREKIGAMEGEPMGKAALGVQRANGELYFSFSLPESKQQEFNEFLKTFGPVRIAKLSDKLGMPEGKNHIILTVKDVSPPKEVKPNEGETPAAP